MAQLSTKIKEYLKANSVNTVDFTKDVLLQDDMEGGVSKPYIKEWNISSVDKPTDSQLDAQETAAKTAESNLAVDATRRTGYGDIGDQLDLLYKDLVAGKVDATGEWAKKIKAVKDANPKS